MNVVLDSNILFSALISGKEAYLEILRAVNAHAPDFIFQEIAKYEERIISKTKSKTAFKLFVRDLFSEITVIPRLAIAATSFEQAFQLCQDVDPKDTPYLALSIDLDFPLWTNDKKLINGLFKKGFHQIITTDRIFELIR